MKDNIEKEDAIHNDGTDVFNRLGTQKHDQIEQLSLIVIIGPQIVAVFIEGDAVFHYTDYQL